MSEKEIKLFVIFLQKLQNKLWTDRLDRLLWYTIWTFHKQYDWEEERDHITEHITEYLSWKADYIDKWYEDDKAYEEVLHQRRRDINEMVDNLWKVINYFIKK